MSDYWTGIEAVRRDEGLAWALRLGENHAALVEALDAFLTCQPEVWWCEEHGRDSVVGDACDLDSDCRMVRARIVVTP